MSAPLTPAVRRALWRIPVLLEEDAYSTDADLMAELGLEYGELRLAVSILYRRRKVDRCWDYVVPPARPAGPIVPPARAA